MKRLLACLVLVVAATALSGCYYNPGYSYVRSSGPGGDVYYGTASYAAPGYYSPYGYGYGYGYGWPGYYGYYGCCGIGYYGGWYGGGGYWRGGRWYGGGRGYYYGGQGHATSSAHGSVGHHH
jgi:hypothetical protein